MMPGPFRAAPRAPIDIATLQVKTARALGLSRGARLRLAWLHWHQLHGRSATLTCRHFGIHRNTFGKWQRRFNPANLRSLEEGSRRPAHVRYRQASQTKDLRLIALKREFPAWGREKIRAVYATRYRESLTSWYVARATRAYHLYCPRKPSRQHHPRAGYAKKHITELRHRPAQTGFLLHLDTIVLHLQGVKRYVLTSIDHASRLAYAWVYRSHTSGAARDFLLRLRYLLANSIENLHTDNGSEFHKHFDAAAQTLGLTHYWSRPRTPKDNAMCERFNRTLKEEFLRHGNFHPDPATMNRALTAWLVQYNNVRPHQALSFLAPLAYAQQLQHLHTMWPTRTSP